MADSIPMNVKNDHVGDSAFNKRVRRHVAGRVRAYHAITSPDFEILCRQELIGMGIDPTAMSMHTGGVTFTGRLADCQRANLHLRTVTRILLRIGAFAATNERQLERKSSEIPWELFLPSGRMPDIRVSSRRSRLYHTEAITEGLQSGIATRSIGSLGSAPASIPQTLFVRAVEDRFTLSLDSSGDPLYKRGLKAGQARAPIRETLAAAILMTAGYDPRRPLVDPLCGSGTFSLEAAMMAKQMAPGVKRTFAFMGWPAFRESQWGFMKREAEAQVQDLEQSLIFASDIDAGACERLTGMIAGNGLSDAVQVGQKDFFQCEAAQYGGGTGLVAINPPYGVRIGSAKQADDLFMDICRHLTKRFKGWKVAMIAPRPALASRLPFSVRRMVLLHGGLKLTLIVGTIKS
ncbi:class I SAM-dependent RNA methyltransferase [Desulfosarcina sp.]|uniref:THUMP domain-containing class I SAM-dependent RNA methyltransferase n=1 Tax=Desulfosarcina sp. TaxID=2027861 RepID=UPI003970C8E2